MKHSNLGKVDLKSVKKQRRRYKKKQEENKDPRSPLIIVDKGSDVIFNMNLDEGLWKGKRTSEMISDHDGRKILRWVLRKDFDESAVEIISDQLKEVSF